MRQTFRRLATFPLTEGAYLKFSSILKQCGVLNDATGLALLSAPLAALPASVDQFAADPCFFSFHPLFTPYFDFHNQQLTTLGDTVIDDYLSDVTLAYCAHMGIVMTVNSARQFNSVFHNHFALQLFASQLGFASLAIPVEAPDAESMRPAAMHAALDYLKPHRVGVSHRDTAGTSFHMTPLSCGQSPLGWKLSHFVGAVHQTFGPEAARTTLESVYNLSNQGNLPGSAATLLLNLIERYPTASVAEAVLAAQGIPVRFVGKTRIVSGFDSDGSQANPETGAPHSDGADDGTASAGQEGAEESPESRGLLVLSGFGQDRGQVGSSSPSAGVTLDSLASFPEARASLASGPGLVNYKERWETRTAKLVIQGLEPSLPAGMSDGWLSPAEQRASRDGPAFAHSVDFALHQSFADAYGPEQPVDGKVVTRRRFKKRVRDPLFYDRLSDMRNGVPLNTDGEPLHNFLDSFHRPHQRLFEVEMLAGNGDGRLVGRAIASRYTVARDSACKAYLGGLLSDLATMPSLRDLSAADDAE